MQYTLLICSIGKASVFLFVFLHGDIIYLRFFIGVFKKYVRPKLPVFDPPLPHPCSPLFVLVRFTPPIPQGTFALERKERKGLIFL